MTSSEIRQLPPSVVNKIAAGEVIERPASVVKELLENALDAGAKRLDVTVRQGGSELVRVVDNGGGIPADQLLLAVAPHATSKLREADDLFRVATLGFRGEALASIAEVSRLVLRSRTPDAAAGAELEVVGGQASDVAPCGCAVGTAIEVHNLFFNTPVRRKFLKGVSTEMGHVSEAFTRLALAHPGRQFTLRHNERVVYDLPPVENWPARIAALCGAEVGEQLIPINSSDGQVRLSGFAAHPSCHRTHARMQYLFLNGRPIRDKSLQHALGEAYRGLLLTGRYPVCFLNLEMPAELVDVNVHPTKLEVRFQDGGRLYGHLLGTLRTKFLTTDLTTKLQPVGGTPIAIGSRDDADALGIDEQQHNLELRKELVSWAKSELAQRGATIEQPSAEMTTAVGHAPEAIPRPRQPLQFHELDRDVLPAAPVSEDDEESAPWERDLERFVAESAGETGAATQPNWPNTIPAPHSAWTAPARPPQAMQVHNRYVIVESEDGVLVIDQHALHERVLYEQLRDRVSRGDLETQQLLVPEPIDLAPVEAAAVLARGELLSRLGLKVEPFGGMTVLVTGYPAMLANIDPRSVLAGVVERILAGDKEPERRDLLDELLHMIACKAAIKAGDKLSPEEVTALVAQRHLAQDAHHCPHGRPTALLFTRDQLDRQFLRT